MNILEAFRRLLVFWVFVFFAIPRAVFAECIGVVTAGGGVDFWHKVGEGAIQAGKENDIEVIVRGPKDETSADTQAKLVEHMLQIGCKGLVVAPNTPERLEQLADLYSKGLPSVLIDRDFHSNEFLVVKTNNYKAGAKAANEMLRYLPPDANVALLKLSPNVSSTSDREQGFLDRMNEIGANIVVNEYIGTKRTQATTKAFELLSDYNELDAIFTPNESTTMAVLNSRKRLGIAKKTLHIGFDSHPSFIAAIEKNELHSIVVQKPYDIGYLALNELKRLLDEGNNVEVESDGLNKKIETPVLLIDKNNLIR